jgi:septum formation protein
MTPGPAASRGPERPEPHARLVLASSSPRRRTLLEEAGYRFEVESPRVAEPAPAPDETPERYSVRLARLKAREVASRLAPGAGERVVVLGADTVVDLEGEVIGQPASDAEARVMLGRLSGSRHAVVTAIVLVEADAAGGGRETEAVERTELEMLPMTEDEIAAYVASGEGRGKAGSYAIQETGDRFVRVLRGSLTNVVGLPMERFAAMLADFAPDLAPQGEGDVDCPGSRR